MNLRIFIIAFALLTAMLSGCSSYPKILESWPSEMPPAHIFITEYNKDPENQAAQTVENYLTWVTRFYEGWVVYDRGWLNMAVELEEEITNPSDRQEALEKIHQIGLLIAPEWAREKESRYIKTGAVAEWGESLLEALSRGESLELMDLVIRDITLLESGDLISDDINIERYFPDLSDNEKDSFFF